MGGYRYWLVVPKTLVPFTCKTGKQAFVDLQVTNNIFSKFRFRVVICAGAVVLQRGIGKKVVNDKTGEIQLCRQYTAGFLPSYTAYGDLF